MDETKRDVEKNSQSELDIDRIKVEIFLRHWDQQSGAETAGMKRLREMIQAKLG